MSEKESNFRIWWNTPSIKRVTGAAYSIGASIVILGAMFKILHLPLASVVLGIGMTTEAILFALGAFDKPYKEFAWDKVFDFNVAEKLNGNSMLSNTAGGNYEMRKTERLNDEDIVKLSEGIKSLSEAASQLNTLTDAIKPTDTFIKNIDAASKATDDYMKLQSVLNTSTQKLATSYDGIGNEVDTIIKGTKLHADKVESINKNLSSMNSLYEIHLKNISAQSESLNKHSENLNTQSEQLRVVSGELDAVVGKIQQIGSSTKVIADETEKYKAGTAQLTKQIAALNQVYGNMLNSLS